MSLIACGTCGHGIAEEVDSCPSCGKKYGAERFKIRCPSCIGLGGSPGKVPFFLSSGEVLYSDCDKCIRTGYYLVSGHVDVCPDCNGAGHNMVQYIVKEGGFFTSTKYGTRPETCKKCKGTGAINWNK